MPIHQPVRTTIHPNDFRDKTYQFRVESTSTNQERMGMLTVSASAGYLLTTSFSEELKREQTFEHIRQTDGSWSATGTVTLLATGDTPVNGTISIRNSLAEKIIVTIDVAPTTAIATLQHPLLTVSQPVLTFPQTQPGKPSFQILTVGQQPGDVSVTLTTDAPEHFQLASDSRPTFLPTLTLTPSTVGTYVHIRYSANKAGLHSGELTIQNIYEKRTVELKGRSLGILPAIRNPLPPINQITLRRPARPSIAKRWVLLLAFATISGIGYAGYSNRCQFFPALCHETDAIQPGAENKRPSVVSSPAGDASEKVALNNVARQAKSKDTRSSVQEPDNRTHMPSANAPAKQTTSDASEQERSQKTEASESTVQRKLNRQENENPPERRTLQRIDPTTSAEESELERMLNQKP